ncbi:MAG TPA: hypothetical protein VKH20_00250 [Solirubrobacterales bacterium]|nr:hypothetical protein [Solirubrobacterales bacterium]
MAFLSTLDFFELLALLFEPLGPILFRGADFFLACFALLPFVDSAIAYFPSYLQSVWTIGSIALPKMGYPVAVESQGATTSQRAAARSRRQREHGQQLREQARLHQLTERRRAQRKLVAARERCARWVASSQRRGRLAKIKCLRAAERSREAAHSARERSKQIAHSARERAEAH